MFFIASLHERPKRAHLACLPNASIMAAMNIVLVFSFVKFVTELGPVMMLPKAQRMESITVFYYITSVMAVSIMILYALSKGRMSRNYLIIPGIFAAIDLAIGFRSMFLALAAVAVAYCESREIVFTPRSKAKVAALGLLVVVAAFVYKPLQGALSGGYFTIANMRDYVLTSFVGSEPFACAGVLNEVIVKEPKLPEGYFAGSLVQYVPFYMDITNGRWHKFNEVCQSLFPEARWGLASTSFGELYTVGGWLAILTFVLVQLLCLWSRPPSQPYLAALYHYLGPYMFIYFYRNDWHFVLGIMRQCAITAAMVAVVYVMISALKYARQMRSTVTEVTLS